MTTRRAIGDLLGVELVGPDQGLGGFYLRLRLRSGHRQGLEVCRRAVVDSVVKVALATETTARYRLIKQGDQWIGSLEVAPAEQFPPAERAAQAHLRDQGFEFVLAY